MNREVLDEMARCTCAGCAHFDPRSSRCVLHFAPHTVPKPECTTCPLWRKRGDR